MLVAQRAQHAYDACASSSMSDADCSLVATWDDSSPAGYLAVNEVRRCRSMWDIPGQAPLKACTTLPMMPVEPQC